MIQLSKSLNAWGTPEFGNALKMEIEQLDAQQLPLQQGLSNSSHVTDRPFQAMILSTREEPGLIKVRLGVFYTGVIAGCSCADDPTPVDEQTEYCVMQLAIDRVTATTTVTLLVE
ncbi:MAG: hypothetical protein ACYCZA_11745 [Thiobacillus sp.]